MHLVSRKWSLAAAGVTLLWGTAAHASHVGVNLNINLGNPPVVVAPAPVAVVPPPAGPLYLDDIQEPPEFVYPGQLGFYVAVGVPYDMFYIGTTYYLFRDNAWYRSPRYGGPWRAVPFRALPPGLRRHRFDRIRYYRDMEYRHYRHDRDRYRGRWFRPEREWRDHRHEGHREMREDQWRDRCDRCHGHRHDD